MIEFVVEDVFYITGRGPVITRTREASAAARDAGEFFENGQTLQCGDLEAVITGIERFPCFGPTGQLQGALLLRGVTEEQLKPGQVWVGNMSCANCERCTWNPGEDCGLLEHVHCERCGHCEGRHVRGSCR